MGKVMVHPNKFLTKGSIILFSLALILSAFSFVFGGGNVKANNPIIITTPEELDSIRIDMEGDYVLGADINLDIAPYNEGSGWYPIGDRGYDEQKNGEFKGTFDGKGHTISGLMVNRKIYGGLFGLVNGSATISNVNLVDVNITNGHSVGAVLGEMGNGGLIENVSVTGNITGQDKIGGIAGYLSNAKLKNSKANITVKSIDGRAGGLVGGGGGDGFLIEGSTSAGLVETNGSMAGGLAGEANNVKNSSSSAKVVSTNADKYNNVGGLIGYVHPFQGEITNSFATGDVEAISNNVGGLIGYLNVKGMSTIVTNSYATGTVTGKDNVGGLVGHFVSTTIKDSYATGDVYGENKVGGLVGLIEGKETNILKSYASGNVNATGNEAGGFVGQMLSHTVIKDAYARGSVSGADNVGGFVGDNQAATVENVYASGNVESTSNAGGLVGKDQRGKYVANFFDKQTTGQSDAVGATAKSTAEMNTQSTFKGWNFTSVWKIDANDYPTFGKGGGDLPTTGLKDISNHWANTQIADAIERGLFTGYPDQTFKPNNPITRAEFVVIIDRALDLGEGGEMPHFADGDKIAGWAKEAVAKAQLAGIVSGYNDGTFQPNKQITRPEIAVMIARAFELERTSTGSTGFSDDSKIPDWAKDGVAVLKEHGIVQGRAGNIFDPKANTTRAEGTVILLNSLDK